MGDKYHERTGRDMFMVWYEKCMWGCASFEYCQARGEMLSGSKAYVYAPWLAEQDCGFVCSHAKKIAFSYKFPSTQILMLSSKHLIA